MSLILAGLVAAGTGGALALGRWLARRRDAKPAATEEDAGVGTTTEETEEQAPKGAHKNATDAKPSSKEAHVTGPTPVLDGFPCKLGDVVMRLTGEEAWLAGGVVFSEEVPVAVLFVAPDAGHDCHLWVLPTPKPALVWLEPLDTKAILVGAEPPMSVELGVTRFERVRRLPLRPRRIGVGAPSFGDAVLVAEYASAGAERLVVFKATNGETRAYRGEELEASTYDVIPSGEKTL